MNMRFNSAPLPEDSNILKKKILERHAEGETLEEIADMVDHYIAVGTQEANCTKTMEARLNFELDLLELRVNLGQVEKWEIIEELEDLKISAIQEGLDELVRKIQNKIGENQ